MRIDLQSIRANSFREDVSNMQIDSSLDPVKITSPFIAIAFRDLE
jgi:hypothetical protein